MGTQFLFLSPSGSQGLNVFGRLGGQVPLPTELALASPPMFACLVIIALSISILGDLSVSY